MRQLTDVLVPKAVGRNRAEADRHDEREGRGEKWEGQRGWRKRRVWIRTPEIVGGRERSERGRRASRVAPDTEVILFF